MESGVVVRVSYNATPNVGKILVCWLGLEVCCRYVLEDFPCDSLRLLLLLVSRMVPPD